MDHSADVARAVAAGVLGVYIVWRAASVLMGREHLGAAGARWLRSFLRGPWSSPRLRSSCPAA
ncbi:hypothetical protein [Pyrobaculum calidifontis]|uniref:hypothetical protein n=1 Tax=Pyrobaculum calidifontis TaxID=181486 RepID=UPI000B1A51B6|nr:hypothetical protein [Pyrobaculum calidifontis]